MILVDPEHDSEIGHELRFGTFKAEWDEEANVGYIYVVENSEQEITTQAQLAPNVIADYADGILVGIEFLGGHE